MEPGVSRRPARRASVSESRWRRLPSGMVRLFGSGYTVERSRQAWSLALPWRMSSGTGSWDTRSKSAQGENSNVRRTPMRKRSGSSSWGGASVKRRPSRSCMRPSRQDFSVPSRSAGTTLPAASFRSSHRPSAARSRPVRARPSCLFEVTDRPIVLEDVLVVCRCPPSSERSLRSKGPAALEDVAATCARQPS